MSWPSARADSHERVREHRVHRHGTVLLLINQFAIGAIRLSTHTHRVAIYFNQQDAIRMHTTGQSEIQRDSKGEYKAGQQWPARAWQLIGAR